MKVQILVDDRVIATQIVSLERYPNKPSYAEIKRIALQAALEDRAIRINEALQSTFLLYDLAGEIIDEAVLPNETFVY
jgi:hypothetical protein